MKVTESRVDQILADLRVELLSRQEINVQAVKHTEKFDFNDIPEVGSITDGCIIIYLDSSNEDKLFADLLLRDNRKEAIKVPVSAQKALDDAIDKILSLDSDTTRD